MRTIGPTTSSPTGKATTISANRAAWARYNPTSARARGRRSSRAAKSGENQASTARCTTHVAATAPALRAGVVSGKDACRDPGGLGGGDDARQRGAELRRVQPARDAD